jgi:hypothetical protein
VPPKSGLSKVSQYWITESDYLPLEVLDLDVFLTNFPFCFVLATLSPENMAFGPNRSGMDCTTFQVITPQEHTEWHATGH